MRKRCSSQAELLLAKPPLKVFLSPPFLLFISSLFARLQFVSELHEFLLSDREPAALADIVFRGYLVLHLSAAFRTVGHYDFTLVGDSIFEGY